MLEALQRCREDEALSDYLNFAYQHAGKNELDQGHYGQAAALFQAALDIRRTKADRSLIESTELALRTAQQRAVLD